MADKRRGATNQSEAGKALVEQRGAGYMARLAKKGHRKSPRGSEYFRRIGRLGGQRMAEMARIARETESTK